MCFYIHQDHQNIQIAEEDITCYKTFPVKGISIENNKVTFNSLYCNFKYNPKGTYRSYPDLENSMHMIEPKDRERYITVGVVEKAIHSYSTPKFVASSAAYGLNENIHIHGSLFIVKCIIPKGTKYLHNPDRQEYVSESITIGDIDDIVDRSRVRDNLMDMHLRDLEMLYLKLTILNYNKSDLKNVQECIEEQRYYYGLTDVPPASIKDRLEPWQILSNQARKEASNGAENNV